MPTIGYVFLCYSGVSHILVSNALFTRHMQNPIIRSDNIKQEKQLYSRQNYQPLLGKQRLLY